MYVEAICPLCLHTHIVSDELRGEKYRCEECEELFIVNRRAKRTHRRPYRPRTVRPADELEEADPLPTPAGSRGPRSRRPSDHRDPPRKRTAQRSRSRVGLVIGLTAGAVLLFGLLGGGTWWYFWGRDGKNQANTAPGKDGPIPVAQGNLPAEPPKEVPPKQPAEPPKPDPPKPEAEPAWKVKVDRPAAVVKLPADFKKTLSVRATNTEVVFPTATGSALVAVGDNFDDKDERQVWNLQADAQVGKLVGRKYPAAPPVLSPDGAHFAVIPFGEKEIVDVTAPASGKAVRIDAGLPIEVMDFAGPGKLLVAGKQGAGLRLRLWDAATGKREADFDGPPLGTPPPASLRDTMAVSPGGAYVAVVTPDHLDVWDLKTGTAAGRRALPWNAGNWLLPCRGLSFSPDGSELVGFFQVKGQSRLVCWDMTRGEAAFDVPFPALRLWAGTETLYKGHVLGWVGDRRGWLLYGQMFIDRKADKVGPAPAGLLALDQPFRRMVGSDHVATMPAGLGNKVLTVGRFDPARPGGP
jgi:hypothetical protein